MRRSLRWLALGVFALGCTAAVQADPKAKNPEPSCSTFGTSVQFEKSPSEAARRARKEEKLVFVLHISGLFEDPDFT
jgi:hypothetical protein